MTVLIQESVFETGIFKMGHCCNLAKCLEKADFEIGHFKENL